MILKSFFKNLKKDFNNKSFNGFEFNSKKIKKNYIFFAIQGSKFNGINFINEFFKFDSEFDGKLSDNIFSLLDKSEFFKRNSISIANKGINFAIE